MKARSLFLVLFLALLFTSCNKQTQNIKLQGDLSAKEAADTYFKYAFSGQVLSSETNEQIKEFSIDILATDQAISTVLNNLGDRNGLFHISRKPIASDKAYSHLPILISAKDHEPIVEFIEVGSDCNSYGCKGLKPKQFSLQKKDSSAPNYTQQELSSANTQKLTDAKAVTKAFNELMYSGKIDSVASSVLGNAKKTENIQNILVVLNSSTQETANSVVPSLLQNSQTNSNDKFKNLLKTILQMGTALIPVLANTNPEVGTAILAINAIMPYLSPMIGNIGKGGGIGSIIANYLADPNFQTNLLNLINSFAKKGNGNSAQLAFATFLPLVQQIVNQSNLAKSQKPLSKIIVAALNDPTLMGLFLNMGNPNWKKNLNLEMLFTYLQPLIQALWGKESNQIAELFNQLVKQYGIMGIKELKNNPEALIKYAQLIPYIEPLIKALKSGDGPTLTALLQQILSNSNPAASVANLVNQKSTNNMVQLAKILFPTIQTLLEQWVPSKQIFAAQLMQGLTNGDFRDVKVTSDIQGSPAVIISGQSLDILKLASLPNVAKVVALK
jgi:hypothetical protein